MKYKVLKYIENAEGMPVMKCVRIESTGKTISIIQRKERECAIIYSVYKENNLRSREKSI